MAAEKIKDNGRLPRCAAAPLAMTDGGIEVRVLVRTVKQGYACV